jgi:hypothetical protein
MKILDIILEDENKEKLIKKAKTIYKGVKTGVLRKGVFGKVVYVLPDEYDIQIDVHDDIFIKFGNNRTKKGVRFYYVNDDDGEMKPLRVNPTEYQMNLRLIEKKKFKPFDIIIWWEESYPSNEPEVVNENEDKMDKKVKMVNKALRKGSITLQVANGPNRELVDTKFRYELPEKCVPYMIKGDSTVKYVFDGERNSPIGERFPLKVWKVQDGEDMLLNTHMTNRDFADIEDNEDTGILTGIFNGVINHVRNRYDLFGVFLDLALYYPKHQPINEDSDRTRKRVKNVYHALKKGIVHRNESGIIYYELPDEYDYKEKGYGDPPFPVVFVGNHHHENSIRFFQQDYNTSKEDRRELDLPAYEYNTLLARIGVLFDKFNISFQRY